MKTPYADEPPVETVKQLQGPAVLDFGTNWCGFCQAAEPLIESAFSSHMTIRHIKVEDGKGRPLGRSYGVKLWPTLIFLQDGVEVTRVVRPTNTESIKEGLERITSY